MDKIGHVSQGKYKLELIPPIFTSEQLQEFIQTIPFALENSNYQNIYSIVVCDFVSNRLIAKDGALFINTEMYRFIPDDLKHLVMLDLGFYEHQITQSLMYDFLNSTTEIKMESKYVKQSDKYKPTKWFDKFIK